MRGASLTLVHLLRPTAADLLPVLRALLAQQREPGWRA